MLPELVGHSPSRDQPVSMVTRQNSRAKNVVPRKEERTPIRARMKIGSDGLRRTIVRLQLLVPSSVQRMAWRQGHDSQGASEADKDGQPGSAEFQSDFSVSPAAL